MNRDDIDVLGRLLRGDSSGVSERWLEEMAHKYPFFPVAEVAALCSPVSDDEAEKLRREAISRIAAALGPQCAEMLVDGDELKKPFYPLQNEEPRLSTESTIDTFLATYCTVDDNETATLEKLIFNPVPDYAQQLARQAEQLPDEPAANADSQDDRINRFILSMSGKAGDGDEKGGEKDDAGAAEEVPFDMPQTVEMPAQLIDGHDCDRPESKKASEAPEAAEHPADAAFDNSLLSESLAKIYIKTKRYERAYEILSRLSLAVPKKNAYFADQLRFLRKLMLIEDMRKNINRNESNSSDQK